MSLTMHPAECGPCDDCTAFAHAWATEIAKAEDERILHDLTKGGDDYVEPWENDPYTLTAQCLICGGVPTPTRGHALCSSGYPPGHAYAAPTHPTRQEYTPDYGPPDQSCQTCRESWIGFSGPPCPNERKAARAAMGYLDGVV